MSKFGDDLIEAMTEALAHARGEIKAREHRGGFKPIDVKGVRTRLKLTQGQMSAILGVSLSGYRKWEQGVRQPSGAARALLHVMQEEPRAVLRALGQAK